MNRSKWRRIIAVVLSGISALLMSISVAAVERDVLLLLDNSGSMKTNDPSRLTAAAVTDFIRNQDFDTRVGIILFADQPKLIVPLIEITGASRNRLLASLSTLDYSGNLTDTAAAVERAIYELRLSARPNADKAIILMTDGIVDTGDGLRDQEKVRWLRENLSRDAERNGIRIFGLAFTEEADYLLLQSLSQVTGGDYFRALEAKDIASILNLIDRSIASRTAARFISPPISTPTVSSQPVTEEPPPPQARERIRLDSTGTISGEAGEQPEPPAETGAAPEPTAVQSEPADAASGIWRFLLIIAGIAVIGLGVIAVRNSDDALLASVMRLFKKQGAKHEEDHGPLAVLYDVCDPSDIKRYELGAKPVVIGRVSGSDPAMDYVVVDERTVGRWHATVERRGQSFWIRDEGSVNGTFVNDQRINSEHPLKHGDMVRVHRHEFEFVIPELFDSEKTMIAGEGMPREERPA
ncbi:MAG: VWA domain-containing protein [Gammaproteobacteria bacterium]|nr:VWA domain-containing protein [Gammaproteobacteria bacterium]